MDNIETVCSSEEELRLEETVHSAGNVTVLKHRSNQMQSIEISRFYMQRVEISRFCMQNLEISMFCMQNLEISRFAYRI